MERCGSGSDKRQITFLVFLEGLKWMLMDTVMIVFEQVFEPGIP